MISEQVGQAFKISQSFYENKKVSIHFKKLLDFVEEI